jgi:hypothetical protein
MKHATTTMAESRTGNPSQKTLSTGFPATAGIKAPPFPDHSAVRSSATPDARKVA